MHDKFRMAVVGGMESLINLAAYLDEKLGSETDDPSLAIVVEPRRVQVTLTARRVKGWPGDSRVSITAAKRKTDEEDGGEEEHWVDEPVTTRLQVSELPYYNNE